MQYEWLKQKYGVYLDPTYYKKILPNYSFSGKSDEKILEEWLKKSTNNGKNKFNRALELGCGNGRGTVVFSKYAKKIMCVDKDKIMLNKAKKKIRNPDVEFYCDRMFDFIKKNRKNLKEVDFLFSFWAINYGLHAEFHVRDKNNVLIPLDKENAKKRCMQNLNILFSNLPSGSKFLFFHYDPSSDEQKIARKYWNRLLKFPWGKKSPSLYILKDFFKNSRNITSVIKKIPGVVRFENEERALETFMNFHLHTFFNNSPNSTAILESLKRNLNEYKVGKKYVLSVGIIIIEGQKIS